MLFQVTADRIARSTPGNCEFCAIAIAVRDTLPEATMISVWPSGRKYCITLILPEKGYHFHLDDVDFDAIEAYDRQRASLKPFEFSLPIPERNTANETCESR